MKFLRFVDYINEEALMIKMFKKYQLFEDVEKVRRDKETRRDVF